MRGPSFILILALICSALLTQAQASDEQSIRDARIRSNAAIAKHDTASLGMYWLDDLNVVTSRSVTVNGRLANMRAFHNEFQTRENVLYVRTTTSVELFPTWNMAAEYGTWVGTWTANGEPVRISGSYYAKWHKMNGVWKIRAEIYTPSEFRNSGEAIIVQNLYFPKAGKEDEVLKTRQQASQVRAQLGLPVGRILLRTSESGSQPHIIWECEYPSLQAREDDVAKLDHSEEFTKVQQHMSELLEKFDRSVWRIVR